VALPQTTISLKGQYYLVFDFMQSKFWLIRAVWSFSPPSSGTGQARVSTGTGFPGPHLLPHFALEGGDSDWNLHIVTLVWALAVS
jgi:hypothetical protein